MAEAYDVFRKQWPKLDSDSELGRACWAAFLHGWVSRMGAIIDAEKTEAAATCATCRFFLPATCQNVKMIQFGTGDNNQQCFIPPSADFACKLYVRKV